MPAISSRPPRTGDFDFALNLYLDSMRRLLAALGRWDEPRVRARFRELFKPEEVEVICSDGEDIGFTQVSESNDGLCLEQLHIIARFRNRGIGTHLIRALQHRSRDLGVPLGLNVIRGNPAILLYRRLGFRIVGEDEEKFQMRWEARQTRHD